MENLTDAMWYRSTQLYLHRDFSLPHAYNLFVGLAIVLGSITAQARSIVAYPAYPVSMELPIGILGLLEPTIRAMNAEGGYAYIEGLLHHLYAQWIFESDKRI